MALVVAFKFSHEEMPRFYLPGPLARDAAGLSVQDFCVAQREGGEDVGFVAALEHWSRHQVRPDRAIPTLLRRATPQEIERWWEAKALERRALLVCKQKVVEHKLPMKVSTVRYEQKTNKLAYLFTSDKRVDFRVLVRDLAALLHCRIELWQIGVREEARHQDGYGHCGLRTCCSAWIKEFKPVNLKIAKEQDIDLPPAKLTGQCGRLLCCLAYEIEAYRELSREALPKGTSVIHAKGRGVVVECNLVQRSYRVADSLGSVSTVAVRDIREFTLPEQMKHMGKVIMAGFHRRDDDDEGSVEDKGNGSNGEGGRWIVAISQTDAGYSTAADDDDDDAVPPNARIRDRSAPVTPRSAPGRAARTSQPRDEKSAPPSRTAPKTAKPSNESGKEKPAKADAKTERRAGDGRREQNAAAPSPTRDKSASGRGRRGRGRARGEAASEGDAAHRGDAATDPRTPRTTSVPPEGDTANGRRSGRGVPPTTTAADAAGETPESRERSSRPRRRGGRGGRRGRRGGNPDGEPSGGNAPDNAS